MNTASISMFRTTAGISSEGRGWNGITVWHQTEVTPQAVRLPPLLVHHIPVHSTGASRICQHRIERRHEGVWRQDNFSIVPAGEESSWEMLSRPDIVHVDVDDGLLRKVSQEAFDLDPDSVSLRSLLCGQDTELGMMSRMLLRELGDFPVNGKFYAESIANVFVVQLVTKFSNHSLRLAPPRGALPAHMFRRTLEHIEAHLGQSLALNELASECGYSTFHFTRLFKGATGLAPHQYVTERRILRAKELLRDPALTICDIAFRCGLVDQSHLTRLFRTHVGQSPAAFRAAAIKDE